VKMDTTSCEVMTATPSFVKSWHNVCYVVDRMTGEISVSLLILGCYDIEG